MVRRQGGNWVKCGRKSDQAFKKNIKEEIQGTNNITRIIRVNDCHSSSICRNTCLSFNPQSLPSQGFFIIPSFANPHRTPFWEIRYYTQIPLEFIDRRIGKVKGRWATAKLSFWCSRQRRFAFGHFPFWVLPLRLKLTFTLDRIRPAQHGLPEI